MKYTEDSIKSLDWREHIRLRPGMYIGKLGDGSAYDDGIYVLIKEIIDNCIDEHIMGFGKSIEIQVSREMVRVRDYGRGIPLGKLVDCVSRINTGGKYDGEAFTKSVGLNGVGTKAVNALSKSFMVQSFRDGCTRTARFEKGILHEESKNLPIADKNGTYVEFVPDGEIFRNFHFIHEFIEEQLWNYAYLNAGLSLYLNGKKFFSKDGLLDLLQRKAPADSIRYPIVHLKGDDIEMVFTHGDQYGEEHYSFVNGQYTTQGGTHLAAYREAMVKTIREFYKKDFDAFDVRASIIGAISLRVQEPVFESQTKTKLGSQHMAPGGLALRSFVGDFIKRELDNYLHKHPAVADALLKRIVQSERERKDMAGIKKLANERAKKANLHNRKLRDCRLHYHEGKLEGHYNSTLFITEGDSASGSITKARHVETQAVFSLRGKPLNCYGLKKKVVYENEEFNLLQHALQIEDGLEGLRYNRIVIATDADVDGMHIRLLMMSFFLQFFPDLVREGHLYILETPLFRVRNKQETVYCYSESEKQEAMKRLGTRAEVTRFKGLGEISPEEFGRFIGPDMRLEPIILKADMSIPKLLAYYMGKNSPERQQFIIENLRYEMDAPQGLALEAEEPAVPAVA
ncbi:MAG: type IIA DNA topoisomerase subunit B [Sphingomonadales bacterium]|nr:type IIA DNA topoisomerase subunit B [Sphingomonadales bacterium]